MQTCITTGFKSEDSQILKDIIAAAQSELKNRGVQPKKSPSRKLSHEEKSQLDFNPERCHAWKWVEKCHEGTKIPMWKVPNAKGFICGLIPIQCDCHIAKDSDNLCTRHANKELIGDNTRCYRTRELFLGLADETMTPPKDSVRHRERGDEKKFIWLEDTDETYDQYKTNIDGKVAKADKAAKAPKAPKAPKTPKAAKAPEVKKTYGDIPWDSIMTSNDLESLKKPELMLYLNHHFPLNEFKGHKKTLCDKIKAHYYPEEEKENSSESSDSEEEDISNIVEVVVKHIDQNREEDQSSSESDEEYDSEEEEEKKVEEEDESSSSESEAEEEENPPSESSDSEEEDIRDDPIPEVEDEILQPKEQKTINVQGIEYEIDIDGEHFSDIKTNTKMGTIDPVEKFGVTFFPDCRETIHIRNLMDQ